MIRELDVMARTVFGEARGEYKHPNGGLASLMAVASVIINRKRLGGWFGNSIEEVCLKPLQFSCWNREDPNYLKIQNVSSQDPLFALCLQVCTNINEERWPDVTRGSDHYHSTLMKQAPVWAHNIPPQIQLGRHVFFKLKEKL